MKDLLTKKDFIYFDWSATSMIKPREVIDAVVDTMKTCASSSRGGYGPGMLANQREFIARKNIAEFFHFSDFHKIIFTKNITESINIVLSNYCKDDEIITTNQEHNSVLRPVYHLQEKGAKVHFLPLDDNGNVIFKDLDKIKNYKTKLLAVSHASNVTGNVIDLEKILSWCKKNNVELLLDTAQSAGELDIDLKKTDIDYLCFTGHKSLLGPQGTGGLIIKNKKKLTPLMQGGSGIHTFSIDMPEEYPTRLEAGTMNIPGIWGLNAGIEYIKKIGIENIYEKAMKNSKRFYEEIKNVKNIKFYGDYESSNRMPIVSLNLGDIDSNRIANTLWQEYNICVRAGFHCAPLVHRHFKTDTQGMIRFSFSHQNTDEEVDIAINAIKTIGENI